MKLWKGRKEKLENPKTVDDVTHTHKYNLKEKNVTLNEGTQNNQIKNRRTPIIVHLIVVLMLICVVTIMCIVGAHSVRPTETAELNKDMQQEEHISAATDIAATSIGTNAKATFTVSTGEIHIYNSSSSADATISKSSWNTFLKKIITADGNLDAVKSITFDNGVYAPADSSRLFYPLISGTNYPFTNLTTIDMSHARDERSYRFFKYVRNV